MAKRPYLSFTEVKEKVPIPDALVALGIVERFQRKGEVLSGVCPLPGHVHGPSPNAEQFKINRRDGLWLWHCFGDCQRGGDVVELVKEMTGYDDAHVRFWFAEKFGDRLTLSKSRTNGGKQAVKTHEARQQPPSSKSETAKVEKDTAHSDSQQDSPQAAPKATSNLPDAVEALKPLRFHLNLDPDVPYLHERGLTAETIQRYGLGLCRRGVLKGYVAIPVFGCPPDSNPLAYLGRWPGDDHDEPAGRPRYKWPDGFLKSHVVYGLSQALETAPDEPLIVVEGPFKVYHFVQAGFPTAVAIFGSSLSDQQSTLLIATGRPIVLMFDGDQAGQAGMRTAAAKLITHRFVRVVKLPEGTEPDDYDADQLTKLLH